MSDLVGNPALQTGYRVSRFIFLSYSTGYYDSECWIDNPFYIDPSSDCSGCITTNAIKEVKAGEFDPSKVGTYITFMRPLLIKVKTYTLLILFI